MEWQPGVTIADLEREAIIKAMRFYAGNRTHAANSLGIALNTLKRRIDEYEKAGYIITKGPTAALKAPAANSTPA